MLSADGGTVAFTSQASNLDPADTDSGFDVYVEKLSTTPVSVSIGNDAVLEGDRGSRFAIMPVRLSAASAGPVTVDFTTVDGTARSGGDYAARRGTLTFLPGQRTKGDRRAGSRR
ncbi:MAG: hypothetical protein H0T66_14525 [Geodermatophilaceae bacterium]|nr:hypothetical protein [Geodermatophilaceae bacterium]MDQ3456680.1 hypothetical protein [Actinomycetota bacterium]